MSARVAQLSGPALLAIAVVFGAVIAAVDNFGAEGEVSPIVVVTLLLVAAAIVGVLASRRAWLIALATWVWVPLAHLVKHVLGMHDTLHPNTYTSIVMLGVFTLVVALVGAGCGVMVRRAMVGEFNVGMRQR